jgi:secondary thiamine-phosphate synthase enzyme
MISETYSIKTSQKTEMIHITDKAKSFLQKTKVVSGLLHIHCPHTTAGITINEAADPSVMKDIMKELNSIVPFQDNYSHTEGNSAAHIKASVIGSGITVPVIQQKLALGTWQGIFFCEFDGPRSRSIRISIFGYETR